MSKVEDPDCGSLLPLVKGSPAAGQDSTACKAVALPRGRSLGALKHVLRPFRQQGWLRRAAAGCRSPGAAALLMIVSTLQAQVASVSVDAPAASNHVMLSWPAVAGATGYNVKRAESLTGTSTTLASNTALLSITDSTAAAGTRYYYTVTALNGAVESTARGVWASPSVILDNATAGNTSAGVSFTGTWAASGVAGAFGNASLFAGQVSGGTPTATYTFTPTIPVRGLYDVYLRWTADPNRATNTPIDLVLADETRTLTVNQEINGGQWNRIATVPCEVGATMSVVIRNNGANGNVVADGVQVVPRIAPWAPDGDLARDYTLAAVEEDFDGTTLDSTKWGQFLDRRWFSVSDGHLRLKPTWIGSTPLGSATNVELQNEANWEEGGIVSKSSQKFGYYEVRLRIPQVPAIGVDTAFWPAAMDGYLHSYEIDTPEFFNKDTDGSSNNFGFGVWDHFAPTRDSGHAPGRTWDYTANNSTIGNMANYVVIGLEWRTDNSQVVYINGVKKYTAPPSGMNDVESILPSAMIISTKVVDWLTKNVELDASEATWDYARYYQKPGWIGSVDDDWSKVENWGAEGLPSGGRAAVFNMPSTNTSVTVPVDQSLQTLSFDGATTPAYSFGGSGALRLGEAAAGDTTVTHGGILLNSEVTVNHSFSVPIVALKSLQFANLSRKAGGVLTLNGLITGSGTQDVEFITAMPGIGATTLGQIVLGQAIGTGIRDVTKAGDATFVLPANSQHSGKTAIARGGMSIANLSALGTSSTEPLVFRPNTRHSETYRPRLIYTGPAGSTSRPVAFTGYSADGIIEASGSGALTMTGDVVITPKTSDPGRKPSANAFLTLGGTNTNDNTFAGQISDAGVSVTYDSVTTPVTLTVNKANAGTWVLTGTNSTKGTLSVNGGRLFIGSGTSGSFDAPSVSVSGGAEIGFGRDDTVTFDKVISGTGGLRKRGSGMLTLGGDHTFTGSATVEAGSLNLTGSLASGGTLSVTANGTLRGSGTSAKNASIVGTLIASPLTFTGTLSHGSTSKLQASFTANNGTSIGTISAGAVTVTSGAKVDVVLNTGTANLAASYWRTARTIPLMTMTSRSGTFALGTVTNDSAGNPVATYGTFTLQHTATAVNLVWTPIPGFPVIDDPTVNITSPMVTTVALPDVATSLRLTASVGGNAAITWSLVSGPGTATFANSSTSDTSVSFSLAGRYVIRATASNALGSVTQDITVDVAPPSSISLRQGVNGYSHDATFIRADTTTWNSGARDQMLVGKTSSAFRALLSFSLSSVPSIYTISGAQLDVWTDFAATGAVQTLELRSLTRSFIEGTGNGSVATNGVGTGADWATHDGTTAWSTAGGDFSSTVLASVPGFNAATTINTQQTFASSPALIDAVTTAITSGTPLNLTILSPLTEAGAANNFTRFSSDDSATLARRPLLTINFTHAMLPAVNPGTAPAATVGSDIPLTSSTTNALSSTWSLISGPGPIWLINPTTLKFSAPGSYVLRLSATNTHGESSRTLSVTVTGSAMTPIEIWRQNSFGNHVNSGNGLDTADTDGDGSTNLLEYATAMNPVTGDPVPMSAEKVGSVLDYTYTKNKSATDVTFTVEWSDDFTTWSTVGVSSAVLSDNGTIQQIKATMPAGGSGRRFVRLRVTR
ncbi:MAG: autotransporter-associated beta strand repeat-containing protein [Verrucomicrobiaceae bacterium]|nr:autotransporter-associated beta strand repeat-containing protein [Verrucomicrobiaceae bacterium]